MDPIVRICCVGAGYVGGCTSAVIAYKNPSVQVTVVDQSEERVIAWNSENLPIFEPGLHDLVSACRRTSHAALSKPESSPPDSCPDFIRATDNNKLRMGKSGHLASKRANRQANLIFSTDVDNAICGADIIFVCVDTPTKQSGVGAGLALDLRHLETVILRIAMVSETDKIIVEKSTVPCGTAARMQELLNTSRLQQKLPGYQSLSDTNKQQSNVNFEILSNPEFLAQGSAITDLLHPDRIIIGSQSNSNGIRAAQRLALLYKSWVPEERIITINQRSSELAKVAANAFLAQRISSINSLGAVCEETGADVYEVALACGLDSRIGPHMLKPSIGFGGSCFEKDIRSLIYLAETLHLDEVASYWKSVLSINDYQKRRFGKHIISCLFPSLVDKKIAVLGFAFKRDTADVRGTVVTTLVKDLVAEGTTISIYDPYTKEQDIISELGRNLSAKEISTNISIFSSAYVACEQAHAVVIATPWEMFNNTDPPGGMVDHNSKKQLDWALISSRMIQPKFLFDGCNATDTEKMERLGFRLEKIGTRRLKL